MSATSIMQAFFDRLEEFNYTPQPVILFPNLQLEPPTEGMWLEPKHFPNEPVDRSWGDDACVEERGFCQVLVYYRPKPKVGMIKPSSLADAIIAHFPKGTALGSAFVKKRPWQSPAVVEDASRSFIPVTITYLGLT